MLKAKINKKPTLTAYGPSHLHTIFPVCDYALYEVINQRKYSNLHSSCSLELSETYWGREIYT